MGLPETLTAEQLNQQRQLDVSSTQFVLFTPNDEIWQTRPASNITGGVPYASFSWNTTVLGDRADVLTGMTFLISFTSDYRTTTFFRGRVRLEPTASTLYINETDVNLLTTDYVTIIYDFDIFEKLERRTELGQKFIDWNLAFTKMPSVISNLQSVYVNTSGDATVEISFAPDVTLFAPGASIAYYWWRDFGDGTITVGTNLDKDVTIQFPGAVTNEHRWVYFQTADDNGTIQYFAFEVFTIDPSEETSTVAKLATNAVVITGTRADSYNVQIREFESFSSVLNQTRCTIVSIDNYGGIRSLAFTSGGTTEIEVGDTIIGDSSSASAIVDLIDLDSGSWVGGDAVGSLWIKDQIGTFISEDLDVSPGTNLATIAGDSENPPINTNISFIGRLHFESDLTAGDEFFGQVQSSNLTIEGFGTQLARIIGPGIYLYNSATPNQWGEIDTLTVGRALIYMMNWYSTFLTISSVTLPSNIHDYDWPELTVHPAPFKSWIESLSDDINAYMIFASSGECTIERHASYSGVGGLDTILTLEVEDGETSDILEFTLDLDYISSVSSAIIGAATYDTSADKVNIYQGRSPGQVYGPGWEISQLNQQIMKSDLTDTQARAETGSRVASHLAFANPKAMMTVRLPTGYYWITPSDTQLYAFNIAASDNTGGRAYTSDDKWLCTSISYTYNAEEGYYEPVGTFEEVTTGGNYGIVITQIVNISDLSYPDLPPLGAGLGLADLNINYPELDAGYTLPGLGIDQSYPGKQGDAPPNTDVLNVSMKTGATVQTHNNSVFGELYTIRVEGEGRVVDVTEHTDFLGGNGQKLLVGTTKEGHPSAEIGAGVYLPGGDRFSAPTRSCTISWPMTSTQKITRLRINISFNWNQILEVGEFTSSLKILDGVTTVFLFEQSTHTTTVSTTQIIGPSAVGSVQGTEIIYHASIKDDNPGTHFLYITGGYLEYSDVEPGDSFYFDYVDSFAQLYTNPLGLLVDGSQPGNIPLYSSEHVYEFQYTGTGFPITFKYNDTSYSNNSNSNILVTIAGPDMALTQII